MPAIEEPVRIAVGPHHLVPRSPVFRHFFVGGNAFMADLLRDHSESLGVTADDVHLQTTALRAREQLRELTARLSAEALVEANELRVEVEVENLSGHKFPTGFPSRRSWLHVAVTDETGRILFESGALDDDGEIVGLDTDYEPHRDVITAEDQVQIYEAVTGDVDSAVTFTLLRAAGYLKDNRIPPRGFVTTAPRYADMAVQGAAVHDADFNKSAEDEGSGRDHVTYRVGLAGTTGQLDVLVELLYQSVPPRFVHDGLADGSAAVSRFREQYDLASKTAETVQTTSLRIDVPGGSPVSFVRGDVNNDGALDITDGVTTFLWLFTGVEVPCVASADADDSSTVEITDGVRILNWLFLGGPEPASPFPTCGPDPTPDALGCESFECPPEGGIEDANDA